MERRRAISSAFPRMKKERGDRGPMFTKTQGSAEGTIYFLDNPTESILALPLAAAHSTTIHLCATGFIYTLQTFIKANLTGPKEKAGDRVHRNSYENAAAARGRFCLNKKRSILE